MNAFAIGPLVFAPDRFAAILAIAAFLFLNEILARKVDRRFSSWAWGATIAFIIGARAGHVIQHGGNFLAEPLRALYIWQGGFMIEAGIALALAYTLLRFRRELRLVLWAALPAAASAYVAFFILQLTAGAPATPLPSGDTFRTLSGTPFQPTTLKGEPIVINLWASWCPPCRREMPMMADVAANTGDAQLVFVNQGEGVEAIRRYLETENLELEHVVLDTLGEFGRHYGVPGLPATFFIGSDGMLQSVHMGEISRETLAAGIHLIAKDEAAR
ncbi:TlpA family protein disulfide reductase [Falsochrobactrum sp. TDYN1]|uniref:TlpA family protein disulfide reductase n=1 Tax=Falsochrobactrum tianjinense TaxID=2706015 RepID=A0A949PP49_9HYPH|nr:TlpA disulfide reductase family protein [Falsochrobactrum sp. TDYN1]MBV2143471.1 TlpA family protein disulfide reductase [Falsochrobactrum sp. TDYN1]